MREVTGDLWKYESDVICIPTNGSSRRMFIGNVAVMGTGLARDAKFRYPGIDFKLGRSLLFPGNHVAVIWLDGDKEIWNFPTKENWWEDSRLDLIARSAAEVMVRLGDRELVVVIPRVGCGEGRLSWSRVKEAIGGILDDRVVVVSGDGGLG